MVVRPARDAAELAQALKLRDRIFCGEQGVSAGAERDGRDGEALHLVAVEEGRVLGTCRLVFGDHAAFLGRLAVDAAHRRRGIGAALLCEATEHALAVGARRIMVHNAFRGSANHRLEEVDLALWSNYSRTAVWGSYFSARAAFPYLRAAGPRGRLVLVTSPSGVEGSVNMPVYSPVKAAQRAMAKSLAREWGEYGITVNCIAPVAETPALVGAFERNPVLKERLTARTPLGRVGDPERDIGAVVAFLASDAAGYVTGQTIVCDGGSFTGL